MSEPTRTDYKFNGFTLDGITEDTINNKWTFIKNNPTITINWLKYFSIIIIEEEAEVTIEKTKAVKGEFIEFTVRYLKDKSKKTTAKGVTLNGVSTGTSFSFTMPENDVTITAHSEESTGCFTKGTLIMLSNGTYKKIENLCVGDIIKTFNHELGIFENQPITYIPYHSKSIYEVLELKFENNYTIKVLFAHGFMNASTRKYEEISASNVDSKLGEFYLFVDNLSFIKRKLISYEIYNEETECFSLSSAYNLNHIANGALCISDDISGLYNYFELDETYKYDVSKMKNDINNYGLLNYDDVSYFMSREIYELFNVKYLSISIGKGLITIKQMEEYILKFA